MATATTMATATCSTRKHVSNHPQPAASSLERSLDVTCNAVDHLRIRTRNAPGATDVPVAAPVSTTAATMAAITTVTVVTVVIPMMVVPAMPLRRCRPVLEYAATTRPPAAEAIVVVLVAGI